jgi:hypothetical protein
MTAQLTHQAAQAQSASPASPAGRGRPATVFGRIVLAVQEMNYATLRMGELQAPWSVDKQSHRK